MIVKKKRKSKLKKIYKNNFKNGKPIFQTIKLVLLVFAQEMKFKFQKYVSDHEKISQKSLFFQVKQQVLKDLQQPKLMNSANKL
jgi:hypothetical protein